MMFLGLVDIKREQNFSFLSSLLQFLMALIMIGCVQLICQSERSYVRDLAQIWDNIS